MPQIINTTGNRGLDKELDDLRKRIKDGVEVDKTINQNIVQLEQTLTDLSTTINNYINQFNTYVYNESVSEDTSSSTGFVKSFFSGGW